MGRQAKKQRVRAASYGLTGPGTRPVDELLEQARRPTLPVPTLSIAEEMASEPLSVVLAKARGW